MALMVIGILLAIASVHGLYLHQSCSSDRDCTQPGMYCYQSGKCVNCSNCSLYNRLPGVSCAKDKNQCGDCLPGMESENNLDGTFSCNPSGTLTPSTQAPGVDERNYLTIIISAVGICVVLIAVCGIYCILKKNEPCVIIRNCLKFCPKLGFMSSGSDEHTKCPETFEQQQQYRRPVLPGLPSYEEANPSANPSAPPSEDPPGGRASPICQKVYRSVENDPSQTANAYKNPLYIDGGNLGTNPEPDNPEEDDNESAENDALISSISHPDDEETQPSTWTPTPGSETASTTGPTSFAGALSMDNLHITQPTNPANVSFSVQHSNSDPNFNFNNPNSPESENSSDSSAHPQVNINVNFVNVCNIASSVSK